MPGEWKVRYWDLSTRRLVGGVEADQVNEILIQAEKKACTFIWVNDPFRFFAKNQEGRYLIIFCTKGQVILAK